MTDTLTAGQLLARRRTVAMPAIAATVVVALMTLVYFGSIVDPAAHLHGLPVAVVDDDTGANTTGGPLDIGRQLTTGLTGTPAVTSRLALTVQSLPAAERRMNTGAVYATAIIPADFTSSIVALSRPADTLPLPTITVMGNIRAGSIGVSLAEAVLEPALASASASIGRTLPAQDASSSTPKSLLADPLTITVQTYRPVAAHAGLGLSAFYFGLLVMMCGFLTAIIVNTFIDSDLGYAISELGPRWRHAPPQPITRWQTLLTKWLTALPVALLPSGALLLVAAGGLRMDAPDWFALWMYAWFAAATVAVGTLVFLAALGTLGQILALLVFVYLGLASSGGTIPLQALGGFFRFVANFEPLRQIVGAVRAILYFNAAGDAGLNRGLVLTGTGFLLWIVAGAAITLYYDKRGLDRMPNPLEAEDPPPSDP